MADVLGLLSRIGGGIKGSQLLNDPYLLSILAGSMAQAVDPKEAWTSKLGGTVAELSRGMKFGEAATKEKDERKEYMDQILKLLGGGLTPKEQPGLTSLSFGPGKTTLEMTPPTEEKRPYLEYEGRGTTPGMTTTRPGAQLDFTKILGEFGNF